MSSILDRIHISEPELYKTDAQLGDFTLDAQFVPLRNPDGTFTFLNTSYSEKPYFHRFIGTPEDILLKSEEYEMDYNGYCDREPSGIWIMSAYKYEQLSLRLSASTMSIWLIPQSCLESITNCPRNGKSSGSGTLVCSLACLDALLLC